MPAQTPAGAGRAARTRGSRSLWVAVSKVKRALPRWARLRAEPQSSWPALFTPQLGTFGPYRNVTTFQVSLAKTPLPQLWDYLFLPTFPPVPPFPQEAFLEHYFPNCFSHKTVIPQMSVHLSVDWDPLEGMEPWLGSSQTTTTQKMSLCMKFIVARPAHHILGFM